MPPKQTDPQFKLRLPADLKRQVDIASAESGRSINAEIVHRLEQSFSDKRDTEIGMLRDEIAAFRQIIDTFVKEYGPKSR